MSETKLYRNPVLFVITVSHEDDFCIGLCQMCIHMFLLFVCQRSSREIRFFPETFRNLFRKRFCKFSGRIYCTKQYLCKRSASFHTAVTHPDNCLCPVRPWFHGNRTSGKHYNCHIRSNLKKLCNQPVLSIWKG